MPVVLRRALVLLTFLAVLVPTASDVWPQGVTRISGLGYLDFRSRPRFKVGDWVRYHFTSTSRGGAPEDYTMTILISGTEKFWGDDCFWVETWTGGRSLQPQSTAFLVSYSIFGDPKWLEHLQVYQRKQAYFDENFQMVQELIHRSLSSKPTTEIRPAITIAVDTLGTDTVSVGSARYRCTKVLRKAGIGMVDDVGDSTMRNENWDSRTLYLSPKIPMTSLVREVDDRWITRKMWRAGKSADAVTHDVMRGRGSLDIEAWGSGDLAPKLTPMYARGPLAKLGQPNTPAERRRKALEERAKHKQG